MALRETMSAERHRVSSRLSQPWRLPSSTVLYVSFETELFTKPESSAISETLDQQGPGILSATRHPELQACSALPSFYRDAKGLTQVFTPV